jgi:hypothetical protein
MTQNTSLGWDSAKGEAERNEIKWMKMAGGENQFRIISGIIPRYVYWLKNLENKPRSFECLQFDRTREKFVNSRKDPIRELGFTQLGAPGTKDEGKEIPLKSKRAYVCQVINRATGEIEYLDLKKSIFDGIKSVSAQLGKSPYDFDIFVKKTGSTWNNTEYAVMEIKCMKDAESPNADRDAKDEALKAQAKDINEVFPVPSYEELLEDVRNWVSSSSNKDEEEKTNSTAANEAIDELELE